VPVFFSCGEVVVVSLEVESGLVFGISPVVLSGWEEETIYGDTVCGIFIGEEMRGIGRFDGIIRHL
jgi:hypothetical protein